jgi:hypothetical protein
MQITVTKGLDFKCCDCGIALYKQEIAYEIVGDCIDYIEHTPGDIRVILCSGCRERLIQNTNLSQGDAILKRKLIERDGAGPLKPIIIPDTDIDDYRTPDSAGVGM